MKNRAERIFSFDHELIKGARVLDLGARFGFWSWAAHQHGAVETIGIEGQQESADRGDKLLSGLNHQYLIGNAFDVIPHLIEEGQTFDVILNFGFFYHIYDHYGMSKLMDALKPKVIVIDSEIDDFDEPVVRIREEKTWEPNNAIAEVEGKSFLQSVMPAAARLSCWGSVMTTKPSGAIGASCAKARPAMTMLNADDLPVCCARMN